MNRRYIAGLTGAALLTMAISFPAGATTPSLRVVDDDGLAGVTDTGAPDCSDGFTPVLLPGVVFATIGAAVTASNPGDTIYVCPGTYAESVVLTKQLTIEGPYTGVADRACSVRHGEATVTSSSSYALDLQASGIVVDGLRIANSSHGGILTHVANTSELIENSAFDNNSVGIDFYASGPQFSTIRGNCFSDNNNGASGWGVRSNSKGLSIASITGNGFWNHRGGAVLLDGGPAAIDNVYIRNNVSTRDRVFASLISVSNSQVRGNTVKTDEDISVPGSAIVVGGSSGAIQVRANNINSNHTEGVLIKDSASALVQSNVITGVAAGISISTNRVGGALVAKNRVTDVTGSSITFAATTSGDTIRGNKALGIANFQCVDLSVGGGTLGTANLWINNKGQESIPDGLCNP